jgi:hypothetical protein
VVVDVESVIIDDDKDNDEDAPGEINLSLAVYETTQRISIA